MEMTPKMIRVPQFVFFLVDREAWEAGRMQVGRGADSLEGSHALKTLLRWPRRSSRRLLSDTLDLGDDVSRCFFIFAAFSTISASVVVIHSFTAIAGAWLMLM